MSMKSAFVIAAYSPPLVLTTIFESCSCVSIPDAKMKTLGIEVNAATYSNVLRAATRDDQMTEVTAVFNGRNLLHSFVFI
jgi:hypothetical protein